MPKVASANTKAAKATVVIVGNQITQKQLAELNQTLAEYRELKEELKPVENLLKQYTSSILELATGLSEEEYDLLTPDKFDTIMQERLAKGLFSVESGQLDFSPRASESPRRNVSWKDLWLKEHSASEAMAIQNDTPYNYSYKVEVTEGVPNQTVVVTDVQVSAAQVAAK
jgi:hypothetical protein